MTTIPDFDSFYRDHFGKLAGSLRLVCGDAGTAEELAQEAFVRAYSRWSRVSTHGHVLGYSTEEAAELLGMSPANLRVTLHRATAALRLDPSFLTNR